MNIAENIKVSLLYSGAADSVTCDTVNMANYQRGAFLIVHTGANDTDLTLSLYEASSVTPSNTAAVTTACPIYRDNDAGTSSDVMARQTDGYSIVIDPATQNAVVAMIEVDPTILSDTKDCCYLADSGGHGSNFCHLFFLGIPRYASQSLVSAIA